MRLRLEHGGLALVMQLESGGVKTLKQDLWPASTQPLPLLLFLEAKTVRSGPSLPTVCPVCVLCVFVPWCPLVIGKYSSDPPTAKELVCGPDMEGKAA
jgi:hypothetical protein